jgi:hypothetical protein
MVVDGVGLIDVVRLTPQQSRASAQNPTMRALVHEIEESFADIANFARHLRANRTLILQQHNRKQQHQALPAHDDNDNNDGDNNDADEHNNNESSSVVLNAFATFADAGYCQPVSDTSFFFFFFSPLPYMYDAGA